MKKTLVLILTLFLFGCQAQAQSISSFDGYDRVKFGSVQEEHLDLELSPIEAIYVRENNLPHIKWEEFSEADSYRVVVSYSGGDVRISEDVTTRKIRLLPGEDVSYQIIPLQEGRELLDYASSPLLISYSVGEGFGGVEPWQRPDGTYSHRGVKHFPQGSFWSPYLAEEIKTWLRETYSDDYLLQGHIAEVDYEEDRWIAPISPEKRREPESYGSGLDCVGFVNGFYYLYTMAFAGGDYSLMDQPMDSTPGVYGSPYSPLADVAFSEHLVIKPSLGGSYADVSHIRPGDINESHDHAWLVSHEGQGLDSRIWEYEYLEGFNDSRSLSDLVQGENLPYDYWISGIANPLEAYSRLELLAENEEGEIIKGGQYRIRDLLGRTLALDQDGKEVLLYRPQGDEFFFNLFIQGDSEEFYDEEAFFTLDQGGASLERLIGGSYYLEELETPRGYQKQRPIEINIEPGEEKLIRLVYKRN